MECDSADIAKRIYHECDSAECESSAKFPDLQFIIPDETSFDEDIPRDECTDLRLPLTLNSSYNLHGTLTS